MTAESDPKAHGHPFSLVQAAPFSLFLFFGGVEQLLFSVISLSVQRPGRALI